MQLGTHPCSNVQTTTANRGSHVQRNTPSTFACHGTNQKVPRGPAFWQPSPAAAGAHTESCGSIKFCCTRGMPALASTSHVQPTAQTRSTDTSAHTPTQHHTAATLYWGKEGHSASKQLIRAGAKSRAVPTIRREGALAPSNVISRACIYIPSSTHTPCRRKQDHAKHNHPPPLRPVPCGGI